VRDRARVEVEAYPVDEEAGHFLVDLARMRVEMRVSEGSSEGLSKGEGEG